MTRPDDRSIEFTAVREAPGDAFPTLVHVDWATAFPWLVQGTTTRGEGSDLFDLGLFSGGSPEELVRRNWRLLCRRLGGFRAVHARQVHGAHVTVHGGARVAALGANDLATPSATNATEPPNLASPCDGHVTAEPGLLLTVTTADCVPVFLVDPVKRAIGTVHAGWRGAAAGVLERGLGALTHQSGSRPADVHVHLGPAICGACYEVGPEVFSALEQPEPGDSQPIDLRRILATRAVAAGVAHDHVSISSHCTRCTDSGLFSHRGGDAARQVGYIGIRSEPESTPSLDPRVGLCSVCRHHRVTGNRRGSQFHLCELSKVDARFRRYPPLPIMRCSGFEPADPDPWSGYSTDPVE